MKFGQANDSRMQRFESRSPSQPVCLQRITYEGRSQTARHRRAHRLCGELRLYASRKRKRLVTDELPSQWRQFFSTISPVPTFLPRKMNDTSPPEPRAFLGCGVRLRPLRISSS